MTPFDILDALLIAPFRLFGPPAAGFLFGELFLAFVGAALGRGTDALVARSQRARRDEQERETSRRSELSEQALRQGDKKAYLVQNDLAQQAYGNTLALAAGRGAALLWPACALLAWLSWRFDDAPMPLLWSSAGPAWYFIPFYAGALWLLGRFFKK